MTKRLGFLLTMLLLTLSASHARAGTIDLWPISAFTKSTNGCVRGSVDGTDIPVVTMDCAQTGTQEMFFQTPYPSDIGNGNFSFTSIEGHNPTSNTGSTCLLIAAVVLRPGVQPTTVSLGSDTGSVTLTANTSNQIFHNTGGPFSFTAIDGLTGSACTTSNCRGYMMLIRIRRDNSGSCLANVNGLFRFDHGLISYD